MRIQHNIMALNAYRQLGGNNNALAKNLEKLSSGYRINRAGDDAAGLAISEKMRAQIKGLEAAQKNANDGISLVQTAEGALTEVHSMLNRMVYLATQSANGTYDNEVDRANLNKEVQTLKEEINRISQSTNFNGLKLLDGSMDSATKTINNAMSDSFKIADWVGSLDNETAVVGTGTIVHTDGKEAAKTSFAIELNNSTVSGENGVKLTLGEGDNAVVMELTKDEIANGASADEVATAMAEKYKDGINFKGADGNDVLFNVTAEGDSIKLEQADAPTNAGQVVNASMKLTTEGLGMPDGAADEPDRLNNTLPTVKDITKDNVTKAEATGTFAWASADVKDEDKDALNKILEGKDNAAVKYSYTGNATANNTADAGTRKVDVSKLQEALGADYEVVVKEGGAVKTIDTDGVAALGDAQGAIEISIVKAGSKDPIGTMTINGTVKDVAGAIEGTLSLNTGNNQTKNVAPSITVEDKGNIGRADTATTAAKITFAAAATGGNNTSVVTVTSATGGLHLKLTTTDGTTWALDDTDADHNVPDGWSAAVAADGTVTLTATAKGSIGTSPFGQLSGALTGTGTAPTAGNGTLTDGTDPLFKLKDGLTEDQMTALNDAIGKDGQTITLQYEKLNGNQAANTSVLKATLGQGLADAGYYLATQTTSPETHKYQADDGHTSAGNGAADDKLYLYDKDNNLIGTITTNSGAATNLTADPATITLAQSTFNKEATQTNQKVGESVSPFEAATPDDPDATPTDLSNIDWSNATTRITLAEGDKFNFTIGDKTYTITAKSGGLSDAEKLDGTAIDISDPTNNANLANGAALRTALEAALNKQVNAANAERAKGTESYTEYKNIHLGVNDNNKARFDITADTTEYVNVAEDPADDPDNKPGDATTGGKDWNAATVKQTQGNAASTGRLASTYITADDLAGLKDGSQMVIGGKTYTFAVGKESKATGDNIVDLKHLEVGDGGLAGEALKELYKVTTAAGDNEMFSTGFDGNHLTFTENKEYKWGEGVDLSTKDGIAAQFGFYADGMTTTTSGKALTLQVGDTAEEFQKVGLDIKDMSTEGLGIADINITKQENATAAIDKIKEAINIVSSQRGDLGAIQNRLEHTINNLGVQAENITAAESRIRDTDMAEEMMAYTKNNILIQAAQAMLAQANQVPQGILQLLQ